MEYYSGNIVDVFNERIFQGSVIVKNGVISDIIEANCKNKDYIIPGFVDSHIHVESSMSMPSEFARIAVSHGTVAAVCDAHEIANVLGIIGLEFIMNDAKTSPFKFFFSVPSCVPATNFETNGAELSHKVIERLFLEFPGIKFLGEMMNYPGVISGDKEVMKKIEIAKKYGKRIDGHAPGLRGEDLKKYISAGITTDHECFKSEEALEKLSLGMKIWIREGSAAKNFDELISIAEKNYACCGFCSDDKHPDDLVKGHINEMVVRALKAGLDPIKIFRMACVNPVLHYGLETGLLRENDPADFIIVEDIESLKIRKTIIGGSAVYENGDILIKKQKSELINNFSATKKSLKDFVYIKKMDQIDAIEAIDGQLITKKIVVKPKVDNNQYISDTEKDLLKIAVVNRYANKKPALSFVKNFGLKKGAIASSVAHDSHNIVAVGVSDDDICGAVNLIIENRGGISAFCLKENISDILPLPIAGLMSTDDFMTVASKYTELDNLAKKMGSGLKAPYMTLSFMALLVIPEIKLSDRGLFDGINFNFID